MWIQISFTRELTMATFDGVEDYYDAVEEQIKTLRDQEKDKIFHLFGSLQSDDENYRAEYGIAMHQHAATYDMYFVNFFRFSTITLIHLITENKLQELCQSAKEIRSISSVVPRPQRDIISEYERYITNDLAIKNLSWEFLHDLNKVRNCIVHKSGKVKGFQYERHINDLTKKLPGLNVSGHRHNNLAHIMPLDLEDDMLVLESSFCKHAIREVKQFFTEFCDAIPLPQMMINPKEV